MNDSVGMEETVILEVGAKMPQKKSYEEHCL